MEPTQSKPATRTGISGEPRIARYVGVYERVIVIALMVLLVLIITLSTVDLFWLLLRDLSKTRSLLLNLEEMLELFGSFLLVLIGMELLASLKSYLSERVIHVEVVLEVALVAIAQKVIILDSSRAGGFTLLGLAALILSLAGALLGVRTKRRRRRADIPS
jgi:uncharacterized membrane protein (DUF373 family)